jgi:hypothetical protein
MSAMNFVHFACYDPSGHPSLTCTPGFEDLCDEGYTHMNINDFALDTIVPKYVS